MKINPTSVGIVKRVPNQKVGLMEKGGQKGGTFLPSTHTDTRSTTPTTPTPTPGGGWRGGGGVCAWEYSRNGVTKTRLHSFRRHMKHVNRRFQEFIPSESKFY